jgi:arylsulfatase A-like enzyme
MTESPNVLVVSLDTVRADVAYSLPLPGVGRLRERGTSFLQAISSCPLTPISHATVFTGRQPPGHGIRHLLREQLKPGVPTLAETLRSAGYATGAVVSCPGLHNWYRMNRGFDFYDDEIPLLPDGRDPLTVGDVKLRGLALKRAPLVADRTLDWLSRGYEPFFCFAHFFDSHWPYEPPEDVGVPVANPYEGEVAYADHHLNRLLSGMADLGINLDSTLVVCFSDHGEDLAGWYRNDHAGDLGYPYEEGHGCLLFDATQHVPLIFSGPGVPIGLAVPEQVRLVDVMPTVLELIGLPAPPGDGTSLVEFFRAGGGSSRPAYSETYFPDERAGADDHLGLRPLKSVRISDGAECRQKSIWHVGTDQVEVYDLIADPCERDPRLSIGGEVKGSSARCSEARRE